MYKVVLTALILLAQSNAYILLYDTDVGTSREYKDCVYYSAEDGGMIKYCLRQINESIHEISHTKYMNNGIQIDFKRLLGNRVSPGEILE